MSSMVRLRILAARGGQPLTPADVDLVALADAVETLVRALAAHKSADVGLALQALQEMGVRLPNDLTRPCPAGREDFT